MDLPSHIQAELSQWNEGKGITPLDWICSIGSVEHLAGYSQLLWPKLSICEGRVFISDMLKDREEEFLASRPAERAKLQLMINALDVTGIFDSANDRVADNVLLSIAQTLRETWTAKLKQDFPGSDARVLIDDSLAEQGVGELLALRDLVC